MLRPGIGAVSGEFAISDEVNPIWSQSVEESKLMDDTQVSPKHLMLALFQQPANIGSLLLRKRGITIETLRLAAKNLVSKQTFEQKSQTKRFAKYK